MATLPSWTSQPAIVFVVATPLTYDLNDDITNPDSVPLEFFVEDGYVLPAEASLNPSTGVVTWTGSGAPNDTLIKFGFQIVALTNEVTLQVDPASVPATPVNFTAAGVSSTSNRLTWEAGVDGYAPNVYRVYRSDTGEAGSFSMLADMVEGLEYIDPVGTPLTTKYYRVRGLSDDGLVTSTGVTATLPATTLAAPAVVTYGFRDTFMDGTTKAWNENVTEGGSIVVMNDPAGGPLKCVRCRVDRTIGFKNQRYRAEVIARLGEQFPPWRTEVWFGWRIYFPQPWAFDSGWLIVTQWHDRNPFVDGGGPTGSLWMNKEGIMSLQLKKSTSDPAQRIQVFNETLGTLGTDFPFGWNRFVARIVWNWDNSGGTPGQFQFWRNDMPIAYYTGPLGYNDPIPPNIRGGCYMSRQQSSANIVRTVYYGSMRAALTSKGGSYSAVDPKTAW